MGGKVVDVVQFFFLKHLLIPSLNSSFMVLTPKVKKASVIEHFRPTMLNNFLSKLSLSCQHLGWELLLVEF